MEADARASAAIATVFSSPTRRPCLERAFVLRAVGIPHDLVRVPAGWDLIVPAGEGERAASELALWERENLHWPPPKVHWAPRSAGWTGAMVYAVVIMACHLAPRLPARLFGGAVEWKRTMVVSGRGDAARLLDGEWWRAVTGLFLHADLPHLAGNLFFGILFGVLVAQALGSGLAWFAILSAGVLGNLANAIIHELWVAGPTHLSIGASTAVFGAIGILTGFTRRRGIGTAATRWGPVLAGLVLLSFLGMGGPEASEAGLPYDAAQSQRTDILSHVVGFGAGIALGSLSARPALGAALERHQRLWAVLALSLPALAWLCALAR